MCAAGDPAPGGVGRQDHASRDEAADQAGSSRPQASVAGGVREVPITPFMSKGQAHARLLLSVERQRRLIGMAAMAAIDAIDRRSSIPLEAE